MELYLSSVEGCCFSQHCVVKSIVYKYFIVHSMRNISTLLNPFHSNIPCLYKRSHRRCSIKIVFLKIQQNSAENTCARLSFKVAGLRPATLFKKRLSHRCFPVNFSKILGATFLQNTSGRLLFIPFKMSENIWYSDNLRGKE